MKEDVNEDRLQRAKNMVSEEQARKDQQQSEDMEDDASLKSEMSKMSRTSYSSEYSRASSRIVDTKGPRSEWRSKAIAVIERGKTLKEEAKMLRGHDASSVTSQKTSSEEREAQIESLVERNALLNERERMLKVESDLLDVAEAAARAENKRNRTEESFLSTLTSSQLREDDESLETQKSNLTSQTSGSRSKRIRDDDEGTNGLSQSFVKTKQAWQIRCANTRSMDMENPTPVKSNSFRYSSSNKTKGKSSPIKRSSSFHNKSTYLSDDDDEIAAMMKDPASPESSKSGRSAKSEQLISKRNKYMEADSRSVPGSPVDRSGKSEKVSKSRDIFRKHDNNSFHKSNSGLNESTDFKLGYRPSQAALYSAKIRSSASVSSQYSSKRSKLSFRGKKSNDLMDMEEEMEITFQHDEHPTELEIPILFDPFEEENGENQPPKNTSSSSAQLRELSYRERSAILAAASSTTLSTSFLENMPPEESGTDEEGHPRQHYMFRQRGQAVKKSHLHFLGKGNTSQASNTTMIVEALGEKKNLYNTATTSGIVVGRKSQSGMKVLSDKKNNRYKTDGSITTTTTKASSSNSSRLEEEDTAITTTTKQLEGLQLNNLVNENKELKARLEKERARRSQLDEKTTHLQLEVHQKGEEISELQRRKDISVSHKEQIYRMEDALQETNRHLMTVVDDNVQLREELEEERVLRFRLENQVKHLQLKLQKRNDEVVALARELQRKETRLNKGILEERHLREVAESQLAKACFHINNTEQQRSEDLEELERENRELRHTVQRLEHYLKKQIKEQKEVSSQNKNSNDNNNNTKSRRRQSGGSLQQGTEAISSKPTWTTTVSEITTDFDFDDLNSSQMAEI